MAQFTKRPSIRKLKPQPDTRPIVGKIAGKKTVIYPHNPMYSVCSTYGKFVYTDKK